MAKNLTVEVVGGAEAFASRLKQLIDESDLANLKQVEQADAIGISRSLFNQWLHARTTEPSSILINRACLRLNANPLWLLKHEGPKRPTKNGDSHEDQPNGEQREHRLIRMGRMKYDQEVIALVELWTNIPKTARHRYMKMIVQEALKQGWIDEVPDAMMASWSAQEKIAELKKKPRPGTQ